MSGAATGRAAADLRRAASQCGPGRCAAGETAPSQHGLFSGDGRAVLATAAARRKINQ